MELHKVTAPSFFVYDLEFVGNVHAPETCFIWDLAVYCVSSGEMFSAVIDPDPTCMEFPAPPVPECMQLTRAFLNQHRAKIFSIIYGKLVRWIAHRCYGRTPVLIAHNNFRTDKPVLMAEVSRAHLTLPPTWFFFDSLLYMRDAHPKLGDYTLQHLAAHFSEKTSAVSHRAVSDVMDLHRILELVSKKYTALFGEVTNSSSTSLRCIPGIGRAVRVRFCENGLTSVEELRSYVQMLHSCALQYGIVPHMYVNRWLTELLRGLPASCVVALRRFIAS